MASPQGARIGNSYRNMTIDGITAASPSFTTLSIELWRNALDSARSKIVPRRRPLTDLMENVIYDGHLFSCMEKRSVAITNKPIQFVMDKGGVLPERLEREVLKTLWFHDLRRQMTSAVPYGFNLTELIPKGGKITRVHAAPLSNVLPDFHFLSFHYTNSEPSPGAGIRYLDDPYWSRYLVETIAPFDLGLLSVAIAYIIIKRGGLSDWAEFAQIFGMPIRIGRYNPFDDLTRKKLEDTLKKMGSAAWAVIPEGTAIELKDGNSTGKSEVYKELINICNSEISKLFLGQTMTTDDGSSRSQSETHERQQDAIHASDMIWMEHQLNYSVRPKLMEIGYPLEKGSFKFPETSIIPLSQRILIDKELAQQIPFPTDYWYKTYGIDQPSEEEVQQWLERQKNKQLALPGQKNDDPKQEELETEKPKREKVKKPGPSALLAFKLDQLYKCSHQPIVQWPLAAKSELDKIWERITKSLHAGTISPGGYDPQLHGWIREELKGAITKGMGDKYSKDLYKDFRDKIEKDVHVFSGFKTYQTLRSATDMLLDDQGVLRSFSQFKEMILQVNESYNQTYLQAEYNHAVAAAQAGAKWVDIEAQAEDLPLLRLDTAGDERVRDDHAALDGITLPVTDSFWDRYNPPLDWGCRCDVTQLAEGEKSTLPSNLPPIKDQFAVNWGRQGIVFPENHPYYKVRAEDKDMDKFLRNLPQE